MNFLGAGVCVCGCDSHPKCEMFTYAALFIMQGESGRC